MYVEAAAVEHTAPCRRKAATTVQTSAASLQLAAARAVQEGAMAAVTTAH